MPEKTATEIGSFARPPAPPMSEGASAIKDFMDATRREQTLRKVVAESSAPLSPSSAPLSPSSAPLSQPQMMQEAPRDEQLLTADEITQIEQDIQSLEKSPELTYEQKLSKHKIDSRTAELIIDSLLFKGEYRQSYPVTKKHAVVFKTRKLEDMEKTLGVLESSGPRFPATVGNIVSKNNLAHSLVRFGEVDFTKLDFQKRIEWLNGVPEALARLLAKKLSKFDDMILDIMDDGVIENF